MVLERYINLVNQEAQENNANGFKSRLQKPDYNVKSCDLAYLCITGFAPIIGANQYFNVVIHPLHSDSAISVSFVSSFVVPVNIDGAGRQIYSEGGQFRQSQYFESGEVDIKEYQVSFYSPSGVLLDVSAVTAELILRITY